MAGTKIKGIFVPPGGRQALKARFLDFGFRHNPDALRRLATDVRSKLMTPREWAKLYRLEGTWVEVWVGDTLEDWVRQPYLVSAIDQLASTEQPRTILYPPPRDESTAADMFTFSVSQIPTSKLSLGITMGGSFGDDEPDDDWERFKFQMHSQLDYALHRYQPIALRQGASREILLPKDLLTKLEVTAAYYFCGMSLERILPRLRERVGDRATLHRWIKKVAKLLDIPMKRRRR